MYIATKLDASIKPSHVVVVRVVNSECPWTMGLSLQGLDESVAYPCLWSGISRSNSLSFHSRSDAGWSFSRKQTRGAITLVATCLDPRILLAMLLGYFLGYRD